MAASILREEINWSCHETKWREAIDYDPSMSCGHHESLRVKSVESDYEYCELCESRNRARDAETRERELVAERDELRKALDAADEKLRSETKSFAEEIDKLTANIAEHDVAYNKLAKQCERFRGDAEAWNRLANQLREVYREPRPTAHESEARQ